MSVGLALAERMLAARFNRDGHEVVDHYTFTIASDGDIQEGVTSEASSFAGHLGLGRLIAFYDDNKIQLASPVEEVFSEDVAERYDAYGWHVLNVGEDLSARAARAGHARGDGGRGPSVADDRPLAHRLRLSEQAGHLERARLAARRGGGAARRRRPTAGTPTSSSTFPRRRSRTSASAASADASCRPSGSSASSAIARSSPSRRELLQMIDGAEMPERLGSRPARGLTRARSRSRPARPPNARSTGPRSRCHT